MNAIGGKRSVGRIPFCFPSPWLTSAISGCLAILTTLSSATAADSKAQPPAPSQPKAAKVEPATAGVKAGRWIDLFDGETLTGWRIADFSGTGEVRVKNGQINLGMGYMTGVTWTNPLPARTNYEIELDAMRVDGSDFFCGLTFPVGESPCSLIVGGWGGGVVGLSSLDGEDAANNETTHYMSFEKGRWYHIRLRVIPDKIQAWIEDEKVVDVVTKERRISIRIEVEPSQPLGIATWSTASALRNIRMRKL